MNGPNSYVCILNPDAPTAVKTANHCALFALATTVVFGLLAAYAHQGAANAAIGTAASHLASLVVCMQLLTVASVLGLVVLALGSMNANAAALFAALACVFLLLDARLYALMGVHIYSPFIIDSLRNPGFLKETRPLASTMFSLLSLLAVSVVVCFAMQRLINRIAAQVPARKTGWWTASILLLLGGVGYGGGAYGYAHMLKKHRNELGDALPFFGALHGVYAPQEPLQLTYPEHVQLTMNKPQSVLLVLVESLRADALSAELMPNLQQFATSRGCFVSPRHYANSHTTVFATFSFLSGLDPHYFPTMRELARPLLPLQVWAQNGYALAGASASQLRDWQDAGFMLKPFTSYTEFTEHAGGASLYQNDAQMISMFPTLFPPTDKPYARFVFFVSTHWNYSYPPDGEVDTPVAPADFDVYAENLTDEAARQGIRNRYRNAVRYVDQGIGDLLQRHKDDIDAGRLAVVIAGDHGEEFWEHGVHGHGATRFYDERIRTPLVMCLPGATIEGVTLSSHADVMPTLFDYMGVEEDARLKLFDGVSLLSAAAKDTQRSVIVTGAGYPVQSRKMAVMTHNGKFIYQKMTPRLDGLKLEAAWKPDDTPAAELAAPDAATIGVRMSRYLEPLNRR